MKSKFWNNIIQVFSTKIFIYIFTFVSSIYISRLLGPEEKGKLDVAIALIGVGVQFGNLGIHSSNTYYISRNRKNIGKACGNSHIVVAILTIVVFIISFFEEHDFLSKIALWIIPVQTLVLLYENILIASDKIKQYNFLEIVANLFYPIVTITASFFITIKAEQAFFVVTLGYGIILILCIIFVYRVTNGIVVYEFKFFKQSVRYGLKAYIACLFSYLVLKADILMINYLRGNKDTGVYSLAVSLSDVLYMVASSVGLVAFPELGRLSSMDEKKALLKVILKRINLVMIIFILVSTIGIVPVIKIAYGEMYYDSICIFWGLLPGVWAMSNVTILNNFFASIDKIEIPIMASIIGFIGNVLFNIIWIMKFGILGAAMASTISYCLVLVILGLYVRKV